ncbi:MAG: hypothetical protein Q8N47_00595, partial [Bryobacterales bacterium]|nr:hypothetical protein [Bryobacterales bacterium]
MNGFLTQARAGAPAAIASQFLFENGALFGLSPAELVSFTPVREAKDDGTGVTHLYLGQRLNGIQVFQSVIKTHVDAGGRVISVEGSYHPGTMPPSLAPRLSARDAATAAMRSTVPDLVEKSARRLPPFVSAAPPQSGARGTALVPVGLPAEDLTEIVPAGGPDRHTVFAPGLLADPIHANLVIFPSPNGSVLAWQVYLHAMDRQAAYTVLIDASSGNLLYRSNGYRFATNPN